MFDPNQFVMLANDFVNKKIYNEAGARTAVSRSYYGVFLILRDKIDSLINRTPSYQGVKNLWADIKNKPIIHKVIIDILQRTNFVVGQELFSLRLMRNESDYHTDKVIDWVIAKDALKKAEMILQDLNNILSQISIKIKSPTFFNELIDLLNKAKK